MKYTQKVNNYTKYFTVNFFYLMFVVVLINIVLRYLFNINYIFLQELVMYMHAFIFLFGVSLCMNDDAHVRIDIISSKLDQGYRKLIDKIGLYILVIPFCLFIFYEREYIY